MLLVPQLTSHNEDIEYRLPNLCSEYINTVLYQAFWQGFILSKAQLDLCDVSYRVNSKGDFFYRYEVASQKLPDPWFNTLKDTLNANSAEKPEWQIYQDASLGCYRAAQFIKGQLNAVIFIAADHKLPERSWLSSLFAKVTLEPAERRALLSGQPPKGSHESGKVVCACFNVGEKTLRACIKEKQFKTHQEVGQCLKAGTNCGTCISEIKALL